MKLFKIITILLSIVILGCNSKSTIRKIGSLPAVTEKGYNAVIEIPAGSSQILKFDGKRKFKKVKGEREQLDFLPFPGNYGFIPSSSSGGKKREYLNVLVISKSKRTGSVIEFKPVAALTLRENGTLRTEIIGIPIDTSLQTIAPKNYYDFAIKYNAIKRILEDWFVNYKGLGTIEFVGWEDDKAAVGIIEKRIESNLRH